MKSFVLFFTFLIFHFVAFCQEGVNFEDLTFDEALAKAKAENKLVFMDCYTQWCGPCKYMTTNIFPQKEAGDFFNPKFVCVKYDAGGGEGGELAKKFGVRGYPTFLIIRPDGVVLHKVVGSGELNEFIPRIERGLNEKTSLHYLAQLYQSGKISKKQLLSYQIALIEANERELCMQVDEELDKVLKVKDKLKKEYWPILRKKWYYSDDFQLVIKHIDVFNENIGKEEVEEFLTQNYIIAIDAIKHLGTRNPLEVLKKMRQELMNMDLAQKDFLLKRIDIAQAIVERDVNRLISLAEEVESNKDGEVWSIMGGFCEIEPSTSKKQLSKILSLEEKFLNLETDEQKKKQLKDIFQRFKISANVGVFFQDLGYKEALDMAAEKRRKLFVYCYSSRYDSCQYTDEAIFKNEEVGNVLNRKFICLKYDMEKGEGVELKSKFGVKDYPTFVIVNPDGTIHYKFVGSGDADMAKLKKIKIDEKLKVGDQIPDFKFLDVSGKEIALSDLKGKYVYIDVWATWCGPCKMELPHLKELEKKMHNKKIEFVSISCDVDKIAWEKMVKEKELGGVQLNFGGDRTILDMFGIKHIPHFILLDKDGIIVNLTMPRPSNAETEKILNALEGI